MAPYASFVLQSVTTLTV